MKRTVVTLAALLEEAKKRTSAEPDAVTLADYTSAAAADLKSAGYTDAVPALFGTLADYVARIRLGVEPRGLLLIGSCGIGKTFGARILSALLGWDFLTSDDVLDEFADDGYQACVSSTDYFGREPRHLIVDELGAEVCPLVHYGTRTNVLLDTINKRYNGWIKLGARTVYTTNLTIDDLQRKYGGPVVDRLFESCRICSFSAPSLRRKR